MMLLLKCKFLILFLFGINMVYSQSNGAKCATNFFEMITKDSITIENISKTVTSSKMKDINQIIDVLKVFKKQFPKLSVISLQKSTSVLPEYETFKIKVDSETEIIAITLKDKVESLMVQTENGFKNDIYF
ncbi:hypothetical protein D3C87_1120760 [compost metagenome]